MIRYLEFHNTHSTLVKQKNVLKNILVGIQNFFNVIELIEHSESMRVIPTIDHVVFIWILHTYILSSRIKLKSVITELNFAIFNLVKTFYLNKFFSNNFLNLIFFKRYTKGFVALLYIVCLFELL